MAYKKPRYQVITSSSLNSVIDETNLKIKQKYVPKGGIINFDGIFYQAVYLKSGKVQKRTTKPNKQQNVNCNAMSNFYDQTHGAPFS